MRVIKVLMVVLFVFFYCGLYSSVVYELDFARNTAILVPTLAIGGYSFIRTYNQTGLSVFELEELSKYNINRIDRFAVYNYCERAMQQSDFLLYACIIAPFLLNISNEMSHEIVEMNTIIAQSFLVTVAISQLTKTMFLRNRPLAYNDKVPLNVRQNKDARYSFISAHTSLAFTGSVLAAKLYDDFHPDKNNTWMYASAVTVASTVGYLRIKAGKHFLTDVLAGAVVGAGSALLMTEVHKKRNNGKRDEEITVPLVFRVWF